MGHAFIIFLSKFFGLWRLLHQFGRLDFHDISLSLQLFSLAKKSVSAFLGTEWSLEVVSVHIACLGSSHVVKLHISSINSLSLL